MRWTIELLGGLRVTNGAASFDRFRTQKTGSLLAYLAFHLGRPHSREHLTEMLWPEDAVESSRHKLSVAVSWLRGRLEPAGIPDSSVLAADRLTVRLNPSLVSTDVQEFENRMRHARQARDDAERCVLLQSALDLYAGPLLPGVYEDWVLPEQQRLEALYLDGVQRLVPLLLLQGEHLQALTRLLRAASLEPLNEPVQQLVIRTYAEAGQPDAALRHWEAFRQRLRDELGVSPSRDTQSLVGSIRESLSAPNPHVAIGLEGVRSAKPPLRGSGAAASEAEPMRRDQPPAGAEDLDPVGGAVPLGSQFYVPRTADREVEQAIARRTSIILLKGAREVGKTSLLARGLAWARGQGARAVCTDFHLLNAEQFRSAESLLQATARSIAEGLGQPPDIAGAWDPEDGPNINFRRFMRKTIQADAERPLVWALDAADRLFHYPFGSEIFALLRAWHNERALEPTGPWGSLTLLIAYATEAHLFITDANQSPFNVGVRLLLNDFTLDQVHHLNRAYGSPLRDSAQVQHFYQLVAGHPYLVRRGLLEITAQKLRLADFEAKAEDEDGVYGSHLRRISATLAQDAHLVAAMRRVLQGRSLPDPESFYRLRSAGLIAGEFWDRARPRCDLYERYLARRLLAGSGREEPRG